MRSTLILTTAATILGLGSATAWADVVRLHSGAELRGKLVTGDKTGRPTSVDSSPDDASVVIETLSGARIAVAAENVDFVAKRSVTVEEYELRQRRTADTVEAHWELANWCRAHHLNDQEAIHCQRVVQLDPEHDAAHRALGHAWREGGWVDLDVYMTERGYVKHKGRWLTEQEFELLEKTQAELDREQAWYAKIRLWVNWTVGNHRVRAEKGLAELRTVTDGDATPAILRLMGRHSSRDVRLLAVQMLRQMPGEKSAAGLSQFVIADVDPVIHSQALDGIAEEHFSYVQPIFLQKLRSANNADVNRAASGLSRVGSEEAIAPLIHALITSHRYNVRVPGTGSQSYSFGSNGSFGVPSGVLPPNIEAGLLAGQYPNGVILLNSPDQSQNMTSRWIIVQQDHQNPQVLGALRKLTGQDFGYDERTWQLWWAAQMHAGGLEKS
ncbi:hypothetical protein GC163_02780 [bacterium]|nr:hypothetical protein [bacterium]